MLPDKLESGFLLFETPQGMVPVSLSFSQRVYLLWTFRHFRQLPPVLLNSRQRSLVNSLFRERAAEAATAYDPRFVIGVVEDFVPPRRFTIAATAADVQPESLIVEEPVAPEPVIVRQEIPLPEVPLPHVQLAEVEHKEAEVEEVALQQSALPEVSTEVLTREQVVPRENRVTRRPFKLAFASLATALCVVVLGVASVVAYHRLEAVPASEAHSQAVSEPARTGTAPAASGQNLTGPIPAPVTTAPAPAAAAPSTLVAESSIVLAAPAPEAPASPKPVAETLRAESPRKPVVDAPLVASVKPVNHSQPAASKLPSEFSAQGAVPASRPPLRFVYPVSPDARTHGVVKLTASIDSAGTVRTVKVVSGNGPLAAAAIRAVRQWRYRPFLKNGEPVPTETNIVISFLSSEAVSMTYPSSVAADR